MAPKYLRDLFKSVHETHGRSLRSVDKELLQLKREVEFHRVPYNQTFDFVTGQFMKILTPAYS